MGNTLCRQRCSKRPIPAIGDQEGSQAEHCPEGGGRPISNSVSPCLMEKSESLAHWKEVMLLTRRRGLHSRATQQFLVPDKDEQSPPKRASRDTSGTPSAASSRGSSQSPPSISHSDASDRDLLCALHLSKRTEHCHHALTKFENENQTGDRKQVVCPSETFAWKTLHTLAAWPSSTSSINISTGTILTPIMTNVAEPPSSADGAQMWLTLGGVGALVPCPEFRASWPMLWQKLESRREQILRTPAVLMVAMYDLHNLYRRIRGQEPYAWTCFCQDYNLGDNVPYVAVLESAICSSEISPAAASPNSPRRHCSDSVLFVLSNQELSTRRCYSEGTSPTPFAHSPSSGTVAVPMETSL